MKPYMYSGATITYLGLSNDQKGLDDDDKEVCIQLKQKLDYLFIITASKLPKFEFWRPFSLVVATVSKQKKLQRSVKKGAKFKLRQLVRSDNE